MDYQDKVVDLETYIKEKIDILEDFEIKLSPDQLEHIQSLENEIQVDNYANSIITRKLHSSL